MYVICVIFVANDMVVIANSVEEANRMLERVREALEDKGLRANRENRVYGV